MSDIHLLGTIGFADRPERFTFELTTDGAGDGLTMVTVRTDQAADGGRFYTTDGPDAYELVRLVARYVDEMTDRLAGRATRPEAA